MLATMLVAAGLLAGQTPGMPEGTKVAYDREGDLTTMSLKLGEFKGELSFYKLTLLAFHAGKEPRPTDEVELIISRFGDEKEYEDDPGVVLSCRGRKLAVIRSEYESEADVNPGGKVPIRAEHFTVHVKPADLESLAGMGRDVEVVLGGHHRILIGPETRENMRRFARAARVGAR